MRAISGIDDVRNRYQKLQSAALNLGFDSQAAVLALEEKAGCIDTVSARGIPWLLQESPSYFNLLRRGIDIRAIPEIPIDEERRRLILAAGAVGFHGYNMTLRAVLDPTAFMNTAQGEPRSELESRSAAAHVLHLAAYPFLNSDFRVNESTPPYHDTYSEVTAYRTTQHGKALGASAITNDDKLVVFQAPENISRVDRYVIEQLAAAHENHPIGPVAGDGLTNHLALIADIAQAKI